MSRTLKICFILLLAVPASLFAQGWPLPAKTQNTEVVCNPCPGYTRTNLKTVGYASPILSFTGRFLDSTSTATYQQPFRTARAIGIWENTAKNRLYMMIGSAVFAYDMNTFFARLAGGEPLVSSTSIPVTGTPHADPHEQLLKYDQFFYAENGSPWPTGIVDGQQRLFDIDFDDQGYVYLAYSTFGWGIVKDDGSDSGGIMDFVYADRSAGEPAQIAYMKTSDSRSYVSLTGGLIYDVTDRTHPFFVRNGPVFQSFVRNAAGDRIAIVDGLGQISVYTPDSFVNRGSPLKTFTSGTFQGFSVVATDGTNFYADSYSPTGDVLSTIRKDGDTNYIQTLYPTSVTISRNFARGFQYGAGFLTLAGVDSPTGWNIAVFRLTNGVPTQVDLNQYILHYYSSPPDNSHVVPQSYINIDDGVIIKFGNKYYLIVEAGGLGDVYEFRGADTVAANLIGSAGTRSTDPLVSGNVGTGPFYGDKVRFTSDASTPVTLTWSFDNIETSADPTSVTNIPSGTSLLHQYSGMTPATLAARPTRTVTATNMLDSTMTGSVNVTLQTPTARFGIKGTSLLFRQPDASSPAPIVAGDKFIDVSDGDVEGHWTGWTLDGTLIKTVPWSATDPSYQVPVGACGSHLLDFDAHYGPYTGAGTSLATTGPDFPVSIHSLRYSVGPLAASVDGPSTDPQNLLANIRFASSSRATADRTLLTSTQVTYRWDLVNSTFQPIVVGPPDATSDITAILPWSVAKSSVVPNSRARLTLKSTAGSGACAGVTTAVAYSAPLNPPPAGMTITGGCTGGGPPCSFSIAGLPADTSGFTYLWGGSGAGTVSPPSATTPTYTPSFSAAPVDYNITLRVSNLVGFVDLSTVAHVTKVVNCQPMNGQTVFITDSGATSHCTIATGNTCVSNEDISFTISPFNYQFACASHSYTWNFGDSSAPQTVTSPAGSNSANTVVHRYTAPGNYTITCLIDNGGGQPFIASQNIQVNTTVLPPPPPPPPPPTPTGCPAMQPGVNVFFTFHNAAGTCSQLSSTPCGTGDQITFAASAFLYNFACATHTFNWDFGDGTTGSGQQPQPHSYSQARTYSVILTISNGSQTVQIPENVTVQGGGGTPPPPPPPPSGSCPTMVANANVFVSFQNATGSCSYVGASCLAGDAITFTASSFNYSFNCATHTFSWDFGDNHSATGSTATHTYANAGTYDLTLTIANPSQSVTIHQPVTIAQSSGIIGSTFDFNVTPLAINGVTIPNAYVFTAVSIPAGAFSTWSWDFGDNSCPGPQPCAGSPVTHIFADNKNYTVTLTVPGQPNSVKKTIQVRHRASGR